jgi:hypothetical protein
MAGAGAPIVTPLSWPLGYVLAAYNKSKDDKPTKVRTRFRREISLFVREHSTIKCSDDMEIREVNTA